MKLMKPFLLLLCITLAGCSSFGRSNHIENHDKQYLAAQSIAPLKMPPGVSDYAFKNEYPVSDANNQGQVTNPNLVPPGLFN